MISVISIDDHEMISLGLEKLFSETKDISLCHFCKTREELVPFIESKTSEELKDMIAMVDIKLEGQSGFDAADYLIEHGIKCLMYSSFSNVGFIVKTGETYIQKDLLSDMMYVSGILVTLTKKERELLDLLGEHLPNEIIAERLGLSKRSVENYVSRIFDKFNVKNRYELGRYL